MSTYINPASNISYTSKDFQTIFPELLQLTKELTSRWDPSVSNESDPGVVLLKLDAVLADKLNYNIDKNILEAFPLSLTQWPSAKKLYSMLGYNMHWYNSAHCIVNISWTGDTSDTQSVLIPPFTMVSDSDGELIYSLICEIGDESSTSSYVPAQMKLTFSYNGTSQKYLALQGVAIKYDINGETTIKVTDLDSENRLYFSTVDIPSNGIFICNADTEMYDWKLVDNLMVQSLGNKYFSFGVTDDGYSCYVEFPEDAEDLFKDGINIVYLRTKGLNGNTGLQVISKFNEDLACVEVTTETALTLNSSNVSIYNSTIGTGGEDPETINDAYKSYKSVVGTFDTLVTLRDYINSILQSGLVSNCFVCDRTNDVQSSYSIRSIVNGVDLMWPVTESIEVAKTGSTTKGGSQTTVYIEEPTINSVDIKLYLMSNIYSGDTTNTKSLGTLALEYIDSFELRPNIVDETQDSVKLWLEDQKHIGNTYADILVTTDSSARPCLFKDKYVINAKFWSRVPFTEQLKTEIKQNILKAFYANLNAAEQEFGQSISVARVTSIIENADTRIKSVYVDTISYDTYAVYYEESNKCPSCGTALNSTKWQRMKNRCANPNCNYLITEDAWAESKDRAGYFKEVLISDADKIGSDVNYVTEAYKTGVEYSVGQLAIIGGVRKRCISKTTSIQENKWVVDLYSYDINYQTFTTTLGSYLNPTSSTPQVEGQLAYGHIVKLVSNASKSDWLLYIDEDDKTGTYSPADFGITNIVGSKDYSSERGGDTIEFYISKSTQIRDEVYAKSILSGVSTLYESTENYMDYNFMSPYEGLYKDIAAIEGNSIIKFNSPNYEYTMKNNETLVFYSTQFQETTRYSGSVKFEAKLLNNRSILANQDIELGAGEYIIFYNRPSSNNQGIYEYHAYGKGTIINSTTGISSLISHDCADLILPQDEEDWRVVDIAGHQHLEYSTSDKQMSVENSELVAKLTTSTNILSGSKVVSIKQPIQVKLDNSYYCYWILNSVTAGNTYKLFDIGDTSRVLGNGECFIYTDSSLTTLYTLGAGTKITRHDGSYSMEVPTGVSLEDLLSKQAILFKSSFVNPVSSDPLICVNNQLYFLSLGSQIKLEPKSAEHNPAQVVVTNSEVYSEIKLTGDGTTKEFTLTDQPQIISQVLVNAVEIEKSDYSYDVTNFKVTFKTAPTSGANISIKYNPLIKFKIKYNLTGETGYPNEIQDVELHEKVEYKPGEYQMVSYGLDAYSVLQINISKDNGQILYNGQTIKLYPDLDDDTTAVSLIGANSEIQSVASYISGSKTKSEPYTYNQYQTQIYSDVDIIVTTPGKYNIYNTQFTFANISHTRRNYSSSPIQMSPLISGGLVLTLLRNSDKDKQKTMVVAPIKLPSGNYMTKLTQSSDEIRSLKLYLAKYIGSTYTKINGTDFSYINTTIIESPTELVSCRNTPVKFNMPDTVLDTDKVFIIAEFELLTSLTKLTNNALVTLTNPVRYQYSNDMPKDKQLSYERLVNKLDIKGTFNYMYTPTENEYIKDPLNPNSFLNSNHPFYNYTICQYDGKLADISPQEADE